MWRSLWQKQNKTIIKKILNTVEFFWNFWRQGPTFLLQADENRVHSLQFWLVQLQFSPIHWLGSLANSIHGEGKYRTCLNCRQLCAGHPLFWSGYIMNQLWSRGTRTCWGWWCFCCSQALAPSALPGERSQPGCATPGQSGSRADATAPCA